MKRIGLAIAITTFLGWSSVSPAWATVYYVNANLSAGANDGSSWANAFHDTAPVTDPTALQRAIDIAVAGDQIWVAHGTYKPSVSNRTVSFNLKRGVKVFGGFSECEATVNSRDFNNNITVLSGDLAGNDAYPPNFAAYGDNSCSVVRAAGTDSETWIDGFTIIGGNSHWASGCCNDHDWNCGGGGIRLENTGLDKLVIRNCKILFNRTSHDGGGVFSPTGYVLNADFSNCVIARNAAVDDSGGIGATKGCGNLRIHNCQIVGNSSGGYAAGIVIDSHSPTFAQSIVNSLISDNVSTGTGGVYGGGLTIRGGSRVRIEDSTVARNQAAHGGGIGILTSDQQALVSIYNSVISGNTGTDGKQLYIWSGNVVVDYSALPYSGGSTEVWGVVVNNPPNNQNVDGSAKFRDVDGPDDSALTWEDNDYTLDPVTPNPSIGIDAGSNLLIATDDLDVNNDGISSGALPIDLFRNVRRVDDVTITDCPQEGANCGDIPVVDLGAFEGPRCVTGASCNDRIWCTLDACVNGVCFNTCEEPRFYGDVNGGGGAVTADDLLATMAAFGGVYSNCLGAVLSGCDLTGTATCFCQPNGTITIEDISQVVAAFGGSYACSHCCPGDSPLMGGSAADGALDAAGQVIGLIALLVDDPNLVWGDTADGESSDGGNVDGIVDADGNPFEPATVLAQAFVIWVERDLSDEDRAFVVELLMANAQNDSSAGELFSGMAKELAD